MLGTISFTSVFPAPWNSKRAPRPGRCPLTLARVLAGRPGGRGGPCPGAPERDGARPARLHRITGSFRPLTRAAGALGPALPALARALPRPRPNAHVAASNPRLARPFARTEDCGRAPDPRAGRDQLSGDQRLTLPRIPLRGRPRGAAGGSGEAGVSRKRGEWRFPPGAPGAH